MLCYDFGAKKLRSDGAISPATVFLFSLLSGTMSSFQNGSSPRSRNAAESDIEAGTSARRSDDLDGGDFSDPFDIARTKNASVERLRRWRVCFLFKLALYHFMMCYLLSFVFVCTLDLSSVRFSIC